MDAAIDPIDALVPLAPGGALHAVRHRRDKVAAATLASDRRLFDPALVDPSLAERLQVALAIAERSGSAVLAAHYGERLAAPGAEPRLRAILSFAELLADDPARGDRAALQRLVASGLDTPAVVALAQLIGYVAYVVRVVAGLQAMAALPDEPATDDAAAASSEAAFVHPATLPPPGTPLRIGGFTSATLGWRAWLPVVDLAAATPEQVAVLEASHPAAKSSDYYRLLVHQPAILRERSAVFDAIMYAPGGLPRAERELASTVVSRVNGCVYCASVHAQRFEQLARRNDVIAQVFADPHGAGTTARERAIVAASIALTRSPAAFAPADLRPLRSAGLSPLETLDLVHAIAIFAWANRLMLNLGEPS